MILFPLHRKMLIKVNTYEDVNPKVIATKNIKCISSLCIVLALTQRARS